MQTQSLLLPGKGWGGRGAGERAAEAVPAETLRAGDWGGAYERDTDTGERLRNRHGETAGKGEGQAESQEGPRRVGGAGIRHPPRAVNMGGSKTFWQIGLEVVQFARFYY